MTPQASSAPWRPGGTSLYVHVPFCASKCRYCDFHSTAGPVSTSAAQRLVDSLLAEVTGFADVLRPVPTVYIGGGTPTLLGERLPVLASSLLALDGFGVVTEFTVEANPDSLTQELAFALAEAGVTRVSLGVQSLDDAVLVWLGRRHDSSSALRAMDAVLVAGLDLSVDLMCGIPVQSTESLEASVSACAALAGHVSVYPLSIEDGTPLSRAVDAGLEADVDPDTAADHMLCASRILTRAGFARYEVASYARPGRECSHNVRYWTGGSYVGVGPSAASMLSAAQAALTPVGAALGDITAGTRVRFLSPVSPGSTEVLTAEDADREDAMLGLRLAEGIGDELARAAGVEGVLGELTAGGLVVRVDGRWALTERGWLLGNEVFGAVWNL